MSPPVRRRRAAAEAAVTLLLAAAVAVHCGSEGTSIGESVAADGSGTTSGGSTGDGTTTASSSTSTTATQTSGMPATTTTGASTCTSTDTYANFGQSFFSSLCVSCHAGYGTLAGVQSGVDNDGLRNEISTGDMPLGSTKPSADQKTRILAWIDCKLPP